MARKSSYFPESRRFTRKSYDAMVAVYSRGEHTFESVKQISEGGLLLEVDRTLLIGDEIQVTFFVPNEIYPPCRGKVVYHLRADGGRRFVGIRFEDISEPLRMKIQMQVAGLS